jgi:Arc/MetJ-type ribon-helix-helix transcriptional regulator
MKISVSLPAEDVAFLDTYSASGASSRSAVLHEAITLLRQNGLKTEYEQAFDEWQRSEDAPLWDQTTADVIS